MILKFFRLQLLVHFLGFLLQPRNLHLSGRNVALQLLDLVVQHKLELLQLLGLLLELVDAPFFLTNLRVLQFDLLGLLVDFIVQLVNSVLLLVKLFLLLLAFSFKFVVFHLLKQL